MIILDEVTLFVWRNHVKILIVFLNSFTIYAYRKFYLVSRILFAGDSSFKYDSVTVVGFLVHSWS